MGSGGSRFNVSIIWGGDRSGVGGGRGPGMGGGGGERRLEDKVYTTTFDGKCVPKRLQT